jgi:Mg2+/Co2+ transporter CorC
MREKIAHELLELLRDSLKNEILLENILKRADKIIAIVKEAETGAQ